jgi:diguanylate cyclase (GGDEF)-like protein/PAS domain S-box-containing protein/putative nucleotidyltransferase with HDIG domain
MKTMVRRYYGIIILIFLVITTVYLFQVYHFSTHMREKESQLAAKSRDIYVERIHSAFDDKGQVISTVSEYITAENWQQEDFKNYLINLLRDNPAFASIYFLSSENRMVNASGWIPPQGLDLRNRIWYQKAVKENALIFTDAFVNASKDKLIITVAKPVYDRQNRLLGVIAGDIDTVNMRNIILKGENKEEYFFIIDSEGNILAHPDYKYDPKNKPKNIRDFSEEVYNSIKTRINGEIGITLDGVAGYIAYQWIDSCNWNLVSFYPEKSYFSQYANMIFEFGNIILSTLIIFSALLFMLTRSLIRPSSLLDRDVSRIDLANNLDYRLPVDIKDPFYIVRDSLNKILAKTQEYFERIGKSSLELEGSYEQLIAVNSKLIENEMSLHQYNTELKAREQALKESEERNRAIIEAIPDLLFIIDNQGTIVDSHSRDEKSLLIPKSMFFGKAFGDILPPAISEQIQIKLEQTLETHELQYFEYELKIDGVVKNYEMRMINSGDFMAVAIIRDITERKRMEDDLNYLSFRDVLTGLYNRRYFEDHLERIDVPRNLPLSLIAADVNGLKLVNDSFGHAAGDELLKRVAKVFNQACRSDDVIARTGGDEFIILLPKTEKNVAEGIVNRIRELAENENMPSTILSVAFGWEAKTRPEQDTMDILKKAEEEMYTDKLSEGPKIRGRTIKTITDKLYRKSRDEEGHSTRVSQLAGEMARALNLSENEIVRAEGCGLFHDIGKVIIEEAILNKNGLLDDVEWLEIKRHPETGFRILSNLIELSDIAEFVLSHHERWDGNGYPKGLKGEEIPIESRIVCLVEAYDAMLSNQSYREALTEDEIFEQLRKNAGTQFDPVLTRLFVEKIMKRNWQD